jgi:hypothetical protein
MHFFPLKNIFFFAAIKLENSAVSLLCILTKWHNFFVSLPPAVPKLADNIYQSPEAPKLSTAICQPPAALELAATICLSPVLPNSQQLSVILQQFPN